MPQLHFSVDERTAQELAEQASARGVSLSAYLAGVARLQVSGRWPEGYLDAVIGSFADDPLEVPSEMAVDDPSL